MRFTDEQLQLVIDRLEETEKFMTAASADSMRQIQTNIFFQLGLRDEQLMRKGMEMLNKQLALMQKDMLDIVSAYSSNSIGFNDAVAKWKTSSGMHYKELFRAGGMASGNPYYDQLGLTKPDIAYINQVRRFEQRFFKKFLIDIKDPKHLPSKQIPRDAKGKMLPGYKRQQFAYTDRAKMYGDSAKTVFFGGQVAGAGPNVRIFWRLGPAERHCEVCPVYATNKGGEGYTWATLPAFPKDGSTPCQNLCMCSLEIQQPGAQGVQPGTASTDAMMAGGRYGRMFDPTGTPIVGAAQTEVDSIVAQMNKARQMIALTSGEEKLMWIAQRRELNSMLIDIQGKGRIIPTISVKELVRASGEGLARGGTLVDDFAKLMVGDEVTLIRGDYLQSGLLRMEGNRMVFVDANGVKLVIDDASDIVFRLKSDAGGKLALSASVENAIMDTKSVGAALNKESSYAFDVEGNVVVKKTGTRNSISYTSEEIVAMRKNAELQIHYHPMGSSFSGSDLEFFVEIQAKTGIVSTNQGYIYEVTPNAMWPTSSTSIKKYYDSTCASLQAKYEDIYYKRIGMPSGMDIDVARMLTHIDHSHEVMQKVASKFNLTYTRTGAGPVGAK